MGEQGRSTLRVNRPWRHVLEAVAWLGLAGASALGTTATVMYLLDREEAAYNMLQLGFLTALLTAFLGFPLLATNRDQVPPPVDTAPADGV